MTAMRFCALCTLLIGAGALRLDLGSLAKAQAEAAQAAEAASEALARANAAQQKVKDLGGAPSADRPFWFTDLFPGDKDRDAQYAADPYINGPTQIDDLGLMFAAIKETRPKTMVEIGFWTGDGTRALLSAADNGTTVHSYDPFPHAGAVDKLKAQVPSTGRNFVFHEKKGEEITSEDLGGSKVGFAFIDPAHIPNQSNMIFDKLLPLLTDDAIIAVHDTGVWSKKVLDDHKGDKDSADWWKERQDKAKEKGLPLPARGKGDEQYYIPFALNNERKFVNWVMDTHPEWGIINFHSLNVLRNGMTLMQRRRKLEVTD